MRYWGWAVLLCWCAVEIGWGREVSWAQNNLLVTPRHPGWRMEDCSACHVLSQIHKEAPSIRGIARRKGYAACTGCHGQNGTLAQRRCQVCHNEHDLPASPRLTGAHQHDFTRDQDHPLADQDCLVCHEAADMDGRWEIAVDLTQFAKPLTYRQESEFCLACHNRDHQRPGFSVRQRDYQDPLTAVAETWQVMDEHGWPSGTGERTYAGLRLPYHYGQELACSECHAMHGTENDKLILDDSRKGVFALPTRGIGYPVRVEEGDYAPLCVLCHQMRVPVEAALEDAGNGLSGVHKVGEDCRPCHAHGRPGMTGL